MKGRNKGFRGEIKGTRAKKEHIGYRGKQKVQLLPKEKVKCVMEQIKCEGKRKVENKRCNCQRRITNKM